MKNNIGFRYSLKFKIFNCNLFLRQIKEKCILNMAAVLFLTLWQILYFKILHFEISYRAALIDF